MLRLIRYGKPVAGCPTLLVIPGIDGSEGSVLPLVEQLAQKREVLLVNYERENNLALEGLTFEVAEAVRAAEPQQLDVLGQSLGTIVAAQLVSLGFVPTRRLVLIGTFTHVRSFALWMSNVLATITPRSLYRLIGPTLLAAVCGPVGDGWQHPFFSAVRKSKPRDIVRRTRWEIGRDFVPDLERITHRTLLLLGRDDRFVGHAAEQRMQLKQMFDGRPHELVVLPKAGHVLLPSAAIQQAAQTTERFLA